MELVQKLISHLFPSRCILCHNTVSRSLVNESVEICASCFQSLPLNTHCCVRCALPLADDINTDVLCGRCIRQLPAFDYAFSLFIYEESIIGLVHQLKFSQKITYARSIGELLLEKFACVFAPDSEYPDCLMPVPLHISRLKQRGFNQSIEIARVISNRQKIPMELDAVIRTRHTESQKGLTAKQRKRNVKGAFSVVGDMDYQHVLIIDDVMTTGSTVNELARLLKKNKVERVGVLSIARAPIKN